MQRPIVKTTAMAAAGVAASLLVATAAQAATAGASHGTASGSVNYQVRPGDRNFTSTAQGTIKNSDTGNTTCAELWFDFRTDPHNHHDAYLVQACNRGTFTGQLRRVKDHRITGMRVAACTVRKSDQHRTCNAEWPKSSYRAGTFIAEFVY